MAEEMVVDKDLPVCIIMWNLIPEKYFHFYSPTTLSCSYLTTVPVWCYIANGLLKRLDEYIEIITQVSLHYVIGHTSFTSYKKYSNLRNLTRFKYITDNT